MDSTLACLAAWMPLQRWYANKGRPPSLRLIAWWDADPIEASAATPARVRTFLVADEGTLPPVLYQIPVVIRPTVEVDVSPAHVIGSPEPGTTFIDGPFDPAYTSFLLRQITRGAEARGPGAHTVGHPVAGAPAPADGATATVLAGEQSNTSLIFDADGPAPVICKVFRQVHPGLSPDIELPTALADAGSPFVPRAIGSVEGTWPDPEAAPVAVTGSLAFAQEFLPGVDDAWRVALRAAAAGEDFRDRATTLGAALAGVHLALAGLFPSTTPSAADRSATVDSWRRRLAIAIAEVPAIAARRGAIEEVYGRALDEEWPPLQRIHGDLHLGQVLQRRDGGWVLLDFEGEPLRPMSERVCPDFALRDVAGMLRSFDYVAGSIRLDPSDHAERIAAPVRAWAVSARTAFLDGYASRIGVPVTAHQRLLSALELDKAVYEAIYESRNRPTWVAIPLGAISRLVAHPARTA